MNASHIVVAYELPTFTCLGTVASAMSLEQACTIVKAFAFVAFSLRSPVMYVVRDGGSSSLYGPECPVNLLKDWQLQHV